MNNRSTGIMSCRPYALRHLFIYVFVVLLFGCSSDSSDKNNNNFPLKDYENRWIILNYWATWCAPCIKEIPELNQLAEEYSDELVVLGFNYDEPQPQGEQFLKDIQTMGVRFKTLESNPAHALKLSRPEGLPVTYLFTPQGKLAAKLVGPQTKQGLLDRIDTLKGQILESNRP